MLLLLIRNILVERQPLYNLPDWAMTYDGLFTGLAGISRKALNDDRIGRALNELFMAERPTMLTELTLRAIDVFKIDLSQFHNDSTTVTVYGAYRSAFTFKGKQTIKLKRGHNKDHRPDLKQLVYCLTVSRDHAVPIHYKVYDGNITDDRTHIETWEKVRALVKRSDFIYVADCKLCTRTQMEHIDRAGGRFITVLPKTRSEQAWFEQWAAQNKVPWKELLRTPDHRFVFSPNGASQTQPEGIALG
jgi:transposase